MNINIISAECDSEFHSSCSYGDCACPCHSIEDDLQFESRKGTAMLTGEVIFFSSPKGYGFLSQDDGGADLFCHFSSIQMEGYKQLKQGARVQYEVVLGKTGKPQAANVKVIED